MQTVHDRAADEELVRLVVGRHEPAIDAIYRRHATSVLAAARRVTRSSALAEEVAQEVFLRLWDRPDAYDPIRGSLRTFLLSVARSRAIDLVRSEAARRAREDREAGLASPPEPSGEHHAEHADLADRVRRALADLTVGERTAIELAYYGEHTYREVARLLGEPEGTVKSRIRSGLRRLQASPVLAGATG